MNAQGKRKRGGGKQDKVKKRKGNDKDVNRIKSERRRERRNIKGK